jgi:hypothetical protein
VKNEIERIISESELIDLVEKRGVGVYPFKKEIDEIVNYVQKVLDDDLVVPDQRQILPMMNGRSLVFTPYNIKIPFEILSKFDWIKRFELWVVVRDMDNLQVVKPLSGEGNTLLRHPNQQLLKTKNGDKLRIANINVTCYSVNKQLQPRTLYLNLYHEFNHNWEEFNRLKTDDELDSLWFVHKELNYNKIYDGCKSSDKDIKTFCMVLYRLWIPDEFNALVSSMYGDLEGMKSTSYTFDYKSTKGYETYQLLKNALNYLKNLKLEKWGELSEFHITSISPQNIESFKEKFIRQSEQKLSDLFHRMNRTASLYYEDKCGNIVSGLDEFHIGLPEQEFLYEYDRPDGYVYIIDMVKSKFDGLMELYQMKYDSLKRFNRLID